MIPSIPTLVPPPSLDLATPVATHYPVISVTPAPGLPMAATHVASIYELVDLIARELHSTSVDRALVPLVTVSRFVGSVALDVLWETQEDLAPLLCVLRHVMILNPDRWTVDTCDSFPPRATGRVSGPGHDTCPSGIVC
ncbi:hypothetical protein K525DRAFT_269803 [Schizophyllum commune Loenen D]|nr:hypothetical protein K525DRAFT_269803 [Schizophyllum commune Loenen D]